MLYLVLLPLATLRTAVAMKIATTIITIITIEEMMSLHRTLATTGPETLFRYSVWPENGPTTRHAAAIVAIAGDASTRAFCTRSMFPTD